MIARQLEYHYFGFQFMNPNYSTVAEPFLDNVSLYYSIIFFFLVLRPSLYELFIDN